MPPSSLSPFFSPRGVVLVGASQDPTKLGYSLGRNLIQSTYGNSSFAGAIHFVNPKGGSLLGHLMIPSIAHVPDPVDLAILLIPAPTIPQALRECGERGIYAVIICSGGFRETGPEGAALEAECLQIAQGYGMRLIGPNCVGLLDTHLPLNATFLPPPGPIPGDVAFISHSGAICEVVIDWARDQGFGFSRLVSLGNQAGINESDVLAPVAADPHTRVLTLYLEGLVDGRRFVAEASQVTRHKPVIALKAGRFRSGQRAAASHTGALTGQDSAIDAAFRRAGVIRANATEEMFDWARALAWSPLPKGRSVAVLTNAGGPGVTASDALEACGLHLGDLREETVTALAAILPPVASLGNPVDMLATASPAQYAACLRLLLEDPGVDSVLVILPPPPLYSGGEIAKALIPIIHGASKPVIAALLGGQSIQEAVEQFRAARIPEYRFPERAASALAVLSQRAEFLSREDNKTSEVLSEWGGLYPIRPKWEIGTTPEALGQLLNAYGIPTPPLALAHTAEEAVQVARQMGFPVALKIASPDILHKSDVGGVLLKLVNEAEVAQGFTSILDNVRQAHPQAEILGVNVQRMLPAGQDVIVGCVQDQQFGALVMFGSGGVEVEGLKDVAFALVPLTEADAEYLLENTWAGRKLHGYRNLPPADRRAVLNVLFRLAQLAADFPQLAEIEINPLRAFPEGEGVCAIDVRGRLQT